MAFLSHGWLRTMIRYGAAFVVVVLGVLVGASLSTQFGIIKSVSAENSQVVEVPDALAVGEVFPDIEGVTATGGRLSIRELLAENPRTLVGFFSAGCGACHDYLAYLEQLPEVVAGTVSVVVVSRDSSGIVSDNPAIRILYVPTSWARLGIKIWPTSVLVDDSAVITGAYIGFRKSAPPDLLAQTK